MIRKIPGLLFFLLVFLLHGFAQQHSQKKEATIKYISREFIYVDAGKSDGLQVGDTLRSQTIPLETTYLIVQFISSHSASCRYVGDIKSLQKGMKVWFYVRNKPVETEKVNVISKEKAPVKKSEPRKIAAGRLRGGFRVGYYFWDDQSQSNLDFKQPSVYLNLKYSPGWNENISMHVKMRGRRDYRSRKLNRQISKTEWRNRVYQFYVSHNPKSTGVIYKFGRIVENDLTGIGYLDGLILGVNRGNGHRIGIIAGTRPDWHYAEPRMQTQKYGVFYSKKHEAAGLKGVTSFALNGEYHQSTVSREYLSFYHSSRIGSKIFLYFFNEMDYNRDWRKKRSRSTIGISNLYLSVQYNWKPWLQGGISLDQRKNYWTYDYYSLADSLFDQNARRGIRLHLSSKLPGNYRLSLQTGLTKRESESQPTISGGLNLSKTNFLTKRINMFFNAMYFHNPFLDGLNVRFQLGKPITTQFNTRMAVRYYRYQNNQYNSGNVVLSMGNDFYFFRKLSITHWIGYYSGDNENGVRTWIELGYYF